MVRFQLYKNMCNQHPNIISKDMKMVISLILDELVKALNRGENCEIRGFGRISSKIQKSRIGRNPKTGEPIEISASRKVKWKMSKVLYKRLNKN